MENETYKLHRLASYSDDALISELQRVAKLLPAGSLTRGVFDAHSRASASTMIKRFGGWREALEAAGLAFRYGGQPVTQRMRTQPGRFISREEVLAELQRVAAETGRTDLTVEDFNAHASFSVAAVRSFFKPWRRALEAAGLTPRATSVRYSDEECYENLLRMWTHLGRPPQYREMNSPPSEVGGKAYVGRWRTWVRALEAFVERANQDVPALTDASGEESDAVIPSSTSDRNTEGVEGRIRLGARYKTLVRDSFKCALCGNSPAVDPVCRLHVDHIHPSSKGGLSTIENLRTLCDACNLGKGSLTIENVR